MIISISGRIGSGKDTVASIIQYLSIDKKRHNLSYKEWMETMYNPKGVVGGWEVRKFAYKLKLMVSILTGCSVDDLESQEFKNKELPEEWNWFRGITTTQAGEVIFTRNTPTEEAKKILKFPERIKPYTYREMLQRFGTEAIRNQIHENAWVNALFADYKNIYAAGIDTARLDETQLTPINITSTGFPNWIITDMRFPNELTAVKENGGITIRVNRFPTYVDAAGITHEITTPSESLHPSETALDNAQFDYTVENNGTLEELVEKVKEILTKEKIIT